MGKKYRLLSNIGYGKLHYNINKIYDEDYRSSNFAATVGEMANSWPQDWELVEDDEGEKQFDFDKAYSSLAKMQKEKDKRYGNSALKPLDIFAKHHPYGSRLDEKLARVKNCDELRRNDVVDLMGGLMLICQSKGWDNFDDLID